MRGLRGRQYGVDLVLVEHVDQRHEALRLVTVLRLQPRHAVENHRVVALGDTDVILGAERLAAQLDEPEPRDPARSASDRQGASLDGDGRKEQHTYELQTLLRNQYADF